MDCAPYSFESPPGNQFWITGRGPCFTFPEDQFPEDLWNPRDLYGLKVLIDGAIFTVLGVEAYPVPISPEHPYRRSFGLLVRDHSKVG